MPQNVATVHIQQTHMSIKRQYKNNRTTKNVFNLPQNCVKMKLCFLIFVGIQLSLLLAGRLAAHLLLKN